MSIYVDVIIPTLDRKDALKETIKSALASSYKRIGITVVIDGNFQLARSLAGWPVKIILNAQRRDWVVSMNKAIACMLQMTWCLTNIASSERFKKCQKIKTLL